MLILPCYTRRRGLGLSVSMTDVSLLINGSTKGGNFNTHLGGLLVGTWRIQCCPRISRSACLIILRSATQAQRDHKIIHARNFRVQPHAIMASGIVEYVV